MRSRVTLTFAALSTLLFVAVLTAWFLSWAAQSETVFFSNRLLVQSLGGELIVMHQLPPVPGNQLPPGLPSGVTFSPPWVFGIRHAYPLGQFGTAKQYKSQTNSTLIAHGFYIRYWILAAITAAMSAFTLRPILRARREKRRAAQGLCPNCGYDLRASPDRCPECGNAVPPIPSELSA